MGKIKHWFWHIVTMLSVCDFSNTHEWSDSESMEYHKRMISHGFTDAP